MEGKGWKEGNLAGKLMCKVIWVQLVSLCNFHSADKVEHTGIGRSTTCQMTSLPWLVAEVNQHYNYGVFATCILHDSPYYDQSFYRQMNAQSIP